MRNTYSAAEKNLFNQLGFGHLLDHIQAPGLYAMAAEQVFINGMKGAKVEALRRGMTALFHCNPYRMTPEFDALVTTKGEDNDTKVYVVVHDAGSDLMGYPFSTKAKAEKAIAEYIMDNKPRTNRNTAADLQLAYDEGEYEEVMEIWNGWSVESNDASETFSVQERTLDADL